MPFKNPIHSAADPEALKRLDEVIEHSDAERTEATKALAENRAKANAVVLSALREHAAAQDNFPDLVFEFDADTPVARVDEARMLWNNLLNQLARDHREVDLDDVPKTIAGLVELEHRVLGTQGFKSRQASRTTQLSQASQHDATLLHLLISLMDRYIREDEADGVVERGYVGQHPNRQAETSRLADEATQRGRMASVSGFWHGPAVDVDPERHPEEAKLIAERKAERIDSVTWPKYASPDEARDDVSEAAHRLYRANPTYLTNEAKQALMGLGDNGTDVVAKRITLNLSSRSYKALESIVSITDDSKTEAINKALQLYAMVQEQQARGGATWFQDTDDADMVRVRFF